MRAIQSLSLSLTALILTACGGGSGGSATVTPPPVATAAPAPVSTTASTTTAAASEVTIGGKITFDNVPHRTQGLGLDYGAITQEPARGVVVSLIDSTGGVIAEDITNDSGDYDFTVSASRDVRVQVAAQLKAPQGRDWDVTVTDNTAGNALYMLEGSLSSSGTNASQTRNLNAPSGWGGASYDSVRAAAPFAILNSVYKAIKVVDEVDASATFPELEIRWSPNNRPIIGERSIGHIGTTGFFRDDNVIYVLGEEGRDTDEYDPHVIVHEWGHYFEENLSRLDSMAGLHSLSAKLDPRLAFSEGWSNAFAAIVTEDPDYKDSSGIGQNSGLKINFETLDRSNKGWFNEASVTSIIYDVFDSASDEQDNVSAGFAPIYRALTNDDFRQSDAFATIFSFSESLLNNSSVSPSDYRQLLTTQSISASNALGSGESNNGTIASALPVYKIAEIGGAGVNVCSVDDAGSFNRLGNRELVVFDIAQSGTYSVSTSVVTGGEDRDPDFNLWQNGEITLRAETAARGQEIYRGSLSAGRYVAEVYDFFNINGNSDRRGDGCFEFSVTAG